MGKQTCVYLRQDAQLVHTSAQAIKWKSPTSRNFHILIVRFAGFQWNLHRGSKLYVKLLQKTVFQNTKWQVMAMYLMYLWFRKTRKTIGGQTIPRMQVAIRILHDFFLSCEWPWDAGLGLDVLRLYSGDGYLFLFERAGRGAELRHFQITCKICWTRCWLKFC